MVMDAYTFNKIKPLEEIKRVCALAGISIIHFRQYANGYARPSVDRAYDLELASRGEMTFRELLPHRSSMPKLPCNVRKTA